MGFLFECLPEGETDPCTKEVEEYYVMNKAKNNARKLNWTELYNVDWTTKRPFSFVNDTVFASQHFVRKKGQKTSKVVYLLNAFNPW